METFLRLFGGLLSLVYRCFGRIVIFGYLPLLSRPEHIVCFFRDVAGVGASTKDVLGKCTGDDNRCWVESFARNHNIPIEWAEKGVRKEDYTRRALRRIELQKRFGVSTSSSNAWKPAQAFAPPRPSIPPAIPTTVSSTDSAAA